MPYSHTCVFCGFSRPGASRTIVAPRCDRCGAVLEALDEPVVKGPAAPTILMARSPGARRVVQSAWVLFCLAVVGLPCAAAWAAVGPALGVAALGGGILALAPLTGPPLRS